MTQHDRVISNSSDPSTSASTNSAAATSGTQPRTVELHDDRILARHAELVAIDNVMGLEARVVELSNLLISARERARKLRERVEELESELAATRSSRTWKVGRAVTRPLSRLRG